MLYVCDPGSDDLRKHRLELARVNRFFFDQPLGDLIQFGPITPNDLLRPTVGIVHQAAHFLVNGLGHFLAVVALFADLAAQEDQLFFFAEGLRAEQVAHAVLRHHPARQRCDPLQVVAGAGGDVAEDLFFGHPSAQQAGQLIAQLVAAVQQVILVGQRHGVAKRHARG